MSDVAICTDSSALLPAAEAARLGVVVVPVVIELEGRPFDEENGVDRFYARLLEGARATTSQPSPGDFLQAYTRAARAGASEVLSIHLHAAMSGTASSAQLAAREAPLPVTVVDTETVSFGVAVCIRAAADALADGAPAGKAALAARRLGVALRNVFVARDAPAGRVGEVSGWAVLEVRDGKTHAIAQCGSDDDAVAAMVGRVCASGEPVRVAVGHSAAVTEPGADALAAALAGVPQVASTERYRVGPAVGAHTGPLSFGAFWWPSG